jgi:hypothetical protein
MVLEPGDPVALTILGEPSAPCEGHVSSRTCAAIGLHSLVPARPGQAVKIERQASLFLGEVRACRPLDDGYALDIEIEHALYDTAGLARLAQKLLDGRL